MSHPREPEGHLGELQRFRRNLDGTPNNNMRIYDMGVENSPEGVRKKKAGRWALDRRINYEDDSGVMQDVVEEFNHEGGGVIACRAHQLSAVVQNARCTVTNRDTGNVVEFGPHAIADVLLSTLSPTYVPIIDSTAACLARGDKFDRVRFDDFLPGWTLTYVINVRPRMILYRDSAVSPMAYTWEMLTEVGSSWRVMGVAQGRDNVDKLIIPGRSGAIPDLERALEFDRGDPVVDTAPDGRTRTRVRDAWTGRVRTYDPSLPVRFEWSSNPADVQYPVRIY